MKKEIVFGLIFILSLMIIMGLFFINSKDEKFSDSQQFKKEIEKYNDKKHLNVEVDEDNLIVYTTYKKINNILENGSGVIFLGQPDDLWTRAVITTFFDAADSTGLEKIHYLNIKTDDSSFKTLKERLLNDIPEEDIIPSLIIFISDGEVIGYNTKTIPSHIDPLQQMTDDEKKILKKTIVNKISTVLDSSCTDGC